MGDEEFRADVEAKAAAAGDSERQSAGLKIRVAMLIAASGLFMSSIL